MKRFPIEIRERRVRGRARPALSGLGNLALLPGAQVTRFGADVSAWTPSATQAAVSQTIQSMYDKFEKLGFIAKFSNISPGYVYSNFRITLSKANRQPFSINDARAAITSVVASTYSLRAMTDAASEIVIFVAEAVPTAVSEKGRQQTADAAKKVGEKGASLVTTPVCAAIEGATGLPCKVVIGGTMVVVGGALAIVYLGPVVRVIGKIVGGRR